MTVGLALSMLVAVAATLGSFVLARALARRLGSPPWASPVLIAAAMVGLLLRATGTLPDAYAVLAAPLTWWLKPAVVALGALLWDARAALRARAAPLLTAVAGGLVVGVGSAVGLARVAALPDGPAAAFVTRTVSTPFAVAIQHQVQGPEALAAAFAVLGGIVGTLVVPPLLSVLRIVDPAATGVAIGVSSHLVGTDWLNRRDPAVAAFAGAALVLAGIIAALVLPSLWPGRP